MTDDSGNEKSIEDARRETEAHLAPDGPVEFVRGFLADLWAGQTDRAAKCLDQEYASEDVTELDLDHLQDPGWGVSGRSRLTEDGDEIVLYTHSKTMGDAPVIIDNATEVQSIVFIVRSTSAGWRLLRTGADR